MKEWTHLSRTNIYMNIILGTISIILLLGIFYHVYHVRENLDASYIAFENNQKVNQINNVLQKNSSLVERLGPIKAQLQAYHAILKNQNYVSLEAFPKNKPGKFDLFISPMPLGGQIISVEYPVGPTGPTGIKGESGEIGSTGPTGNTGSRGNDGNSFQSITL